MSAFRNPRFAKEFAYRTMVNYYNLRDMQRDPAKARSAKLQDVLDEMKNCNFDVSEQYEITLALNSMVGLLIIPQQEYFKESNSAVEGLRELPALYECVKDDSYFNTYNEKKKKPANILKHMRNSLAHNRVMLYPESANNREITHICFKDAKFDGSKFELRIPSEKLEDVMMEIANYLIGFAV